MSLSITAPKAPDGKRTLPFTAPVKTTDVKRTLPFAVPAKSPGVKRTLPTSQVSNPAATLSSAARERMLAVPKKPRIAIVTDTADALQRVEIGETAKRPAPTPARESASGYVPVPTQSNGTTPAMRAMRRAQVANTAMMLAQYNIVKHFVVLDKLMQQATVGAVVAETALDLARSGRF